jgi:hypothetical protein
MNFTHTSVRAGRNGPISPGQRVTKLSKPARHDARSCERASEASAKEE